MPVAQLRADPARAAAGNIVTLRHEHDGQVEYSTYGHLMEGSVRVRVGVAGEERVGIGCDLRHMRRAVGGHVGNYPHHHAIGGRHNARADQSVHQGDVLGRLGDTAGELLDPHLHFQLNAGPDFLSSRSLPVIFDNTRTLGPASDLGRMIETSSAPR